MKNTLNPTRRTGISSFSLWTKPEAIKNHCPFSNEWADRLYNPCKQENRKADQIVIKVYFNLIKQEWKNFLSFFTFFLEWNRNIRKHNCKGFNKLFCITWSMEASDHFKVLSTTESKSANSYYQHPDSLRLTHCKNTILRLVIQPTNYQEMKIRGQLVLQGRWQGG